MEAEVGEARRLLADHLRQRLDEGRGLGRAAKACADLGQYKRSMQIGDDIDVLMREAKRSLLARSVFADVGQLQAMTPDHSLGNAIPSVLMRGVSSPAREVRSRASARKSAFITDGPPVPMVPQSDDEVVYKY